MNIKKFIIAFTLLVLPTISFAQNKTESIDSLMNYCHEKFYFDGIVLVAEGDEIIYEKSFGFANREWKITNTIDTKFRLGSISKQLTSYIFLKIAESQNLSLDEPISKFFHGFSTEEKQNITIRNLLTHTSGLFDYTNLRETDKNIYPYDSLIGIVAKKKSNFKSGTKYEYCNSNFFLLALIAEKISGKKFEDLMTEMVLKPADMKNSGEDHNEMILENRASAYLRKDKNFVNSPFIEMENTIGGGGIYSTVEDLYKWSNFFRTHYSDDEFLKKVIQPYMLSDGKYTIYSCGFCLLPGEFMHEGHINGFANLISMDTTNKRTIIILSNDNYQKLYVTKLTISNILENKQNALDWIKDTIHDINLDEYSGNYLLNNDTIVIKNENKKLNSYYRGQRIEMVPFGKDEFFLSDIESYIHFTRKRNEKADGIIIFDDYSFIKIKKLE